MRCSGIAAQFPKRSVSMVGMSFLCFSTGCSLTVASPLFPKGLAPCFPLTGKVALKNDNFAVVHLLSLSSLSTPTSARPVRMIVLLQCVKHMTRQLKTKPIKIFTLSRCDFVLCQRC